MTVFVVLFHSYDAGTYLIGVYTTRERAEEEIEQNISADRLAYPKHPARYEQRRTHYSITECEVAT